MFAPQDCKTIAIDPSYISKYSFVEGLQQMGFDLVSRLRDDSNLLYLYHGDKSGKKGRPKTFDGKIDVKRLDYSRIWISRKGAHKLYFSTDIRMTGQDVIQSNIIEQDFRLNFAFNASLTAVNAAKVMMKENSIPFSMDTLKNLMYKSYILKRFFDLSGFKPNKKINDKLIKELVDIAMYRVA